MNLADRINILNEIDSYTDKKIDKIFPLLLENFPYRIQKFYRNNDKAGRFYRVKINSTDWYENVESFYPADDQYKYLNRCLAPKNDKLIYCCDENYWNVISELISPKEKQTGKISVLVFEITNFQYYDIALTFSDEHANSFARNLTGKNKTETLEYLLMINAFFKRCTGNKQFDYRVSSRLSQLFFGDFIMKHESVLGIQYMPISREWLPSFGQTFNYAFSFKRVKNLIFNPTFIHMDYRIDIKTQRFYFKNRGIDEEYSYEIKLKKSIGANK